MANLLGQNIGTNYKGILNLGSTINTPVSGILQAVTDGDGLASALSVGTTSVGVTGTLGVTADTTLSGASGDRTLNIVTNTSGNPIISLNAAGDDGSSLQYVRGAGTLRATMGNALWNLKDGVGFLVTGRVGIGTSTPAVPLDVVGDIRTSTGILFGSDTAAANALDDYEEGTWTIGVEFDQASVDVTSSGNTGTYTKIGRQVTVNGILSLTSKGSSTGIVEITGLPFTIAAGGSNFCVASLWLNNVSFANQFVGRAIPSTNSVRIEEFSEAGVLSNITNADFANNSEVLLSLTYFV